MQAIIPTAPVSNHVCCNIGTETEIEPARNRQMLIQPATKTKHIRCVIEVRISHPATWIAGSQIVSR